MFDVAKPVDDRLCCFVWIGGNTGTKEAHWFYHYLSHSNNMTITNKILSQPLTEINADTLDEFEKKLGKQIPASLKELILKYHEVIFERKHFKRSVNSFKQELTLERIRDIDGIIQGWEYTNDDPERAALNLLSFGETLGSPEVCISLSNGSYGHIYVYDHDFGPTYIARSLVDLINALT